MNTFLRYFIIHIHYDCCVCAKQAIALNTEREHLVFSSVLSKLLNFVRCLCLCLLSCVFIPFDAVILAYLKRTQFSLIHEEVNIFGHKISDITRQMQWQPNQFGNKSEYC